MGSILEMKSGLLRASEEFKELIRQIQLNSIREGRKPLSTVKITQLITKQINEGALNYEKFIKF